MGLDTEAQKTTAKLKRAQISNKRKARAKTRQEIQKTKKKQIISLLKTSAPRPRRRIRVRDVTVNKDTRRTKRELFEKTWLNTRWRKKWRAKWGKNKWRPQLKERWDLNQDWRRKWMKRLRENWWNVKWRRKWQELFLLDDWLRIYNKERRKRRRLWRRKWNLTGCRKMGLTFNEFLISQRRLRSIRDVPPEVVRRRRKAKRLLKEGRLTKAQKEFTQGNRKKSWYQRLKALKERAKAKLSPHYDLKPALIQFKFYVFNACQGFLTFLVLMYQYTAHSEYIPAAYGVPGFFTLWIYLAMCDMLGSFFGLFTSNYLSSLYMHISHKKKGRKKQNQGCFGGGHKSSGKNDKENKTGEMAEDDETEADNDFGWNDDKIKKHPPSKRSKTVQALVSVKDKMFGLERSLGFVDRMGCASFLFLQTAFFLNLLATGYYTWMENFSDEYKLAVEKCGIFPREQHCYEFEDMLFGIFFFGICSFVLRTVFIFIIGMCINERFLKRCQNLDPSEELPSTNSDTEFDCQKVPRNILFPFLLSDGTVFPYILPESSRPFEQAKRRRKLKYRPPFSRYRNKRAKRRIVSALEKEANKVTQGFRGIRKATIPLPKGRRQAFKLPPNPGVPDIVQLPPELMTMEARTWLSGEESDSSDIELRRFMKKSKPEHLARKRKIAKVREPHSLVIMHDDKSITNMSITEVIAPKLEDLDNRISTDESWSDKADVLFDPRPEPPLSEVELLEKRKSQEDYMELMAYKDDSE